MCQFCGQAVSAERLRTAVPCPRADCRTLNVWGATRCLRCTAWIVVQCVFCGGLSPYNQSACLNCREPFYGAPQRKAARDAEISRQHGLETVSTVGGVAAPFLGAMAGGAIGGWAGSHWGHPNHYGSGYGGSGGTDPSGNDGSGSVPFATSGSEVGGASDGSFGGITESSSDDGGSFDDASSDAGSSDGGSSDGGSDFGGGSDSGGGGSDT